MRFKALINLNYLKKSDVGRFGGDLKPIEVSETNYDYEEEEDDKENAKVQAKKPSKKPTANTAANNKAKNGTADKKGAVGGLFSYFGGLVGGQTLTEETIEPVMEKMQDHLVGKFF